MAPCSSDTIPHWAMAERGASVHHPQRVRLIGWLSWRQHVTRGGAQRGVSRRVGWAGGAERGSQFVLATAHVHVHGEEVSCLTERRVTQAPRTPARMSRWSGGRRAERVSCEGGGVHRAHNTCTTRVQLAQLSAVSAQRV